MLKCMNSVGGLVAKNRLIPGYISNFILVRFTLNYLYARQRTFTILKSSSSKFSDKVSGWMMKFLLALYHLSEVYIE